MHRPRGTSHENETSSLGLRNSRPDVAWLESGEHKDILELYYKELGQRTHNQRRYQQARPEEKKKFAVKALDSNEYARVIGEHLGIKGERWELAEWDPPKIPKRDPKTGHLKLEL